MGRYRGADDLEWLEQHRQKRRTGRLWWPVCVLDLTLGVLLALLLVGVVVLFLAKTTGGN